MLLARHRRFVGYLLSRVANLLICLCILMAYKQSCWKKMYHTGTAQLKNQCLSGTVVEELVTRISGRKPQRFRKKTQLLLCVRSNLLTSHVEKHVSLIKQLCRKAARFSQHA